MQRMQRLNWAEYRAGTGPREDQELPSYRENYPKLLIYEASLDFR
jgi:hypothetical protein